MLVVVESQQSHVCCTYLTVICTAPLPDVDDHYMDAESCSSTVDGFTISCSKA